MAGKSNPLKFLFWFVGKDLWRSFFMAVFMIWLPILIIGGNAVDWNKRFLFGGLLLMPAFWLSGLLLRALWFSLVYRKTDDLEADYKAFLVRK